MGFSYGLFSAVYASTLGAGCFDKRQAQNNFVAYRDRMVRTALRDYRMDLLNDDLDQIRQYLAQHGGQGDYILSQPLARLRGFGCAILSWKHWDEIWTK